jgi:two-component system OmpR family response regulator
MLAMKPLSGSPSQSLLVVEDDPRVARFIVEGLRDEGYLAYHAADADAAKELGGQHQFALVLLDHMLPGQSGITKLRGWRAAGRDMPVVMLTARDSPEDRRLAFDAGATAFLAKPFKLDVLFALIASLLPH